MSTGALSEAVAAIESKLSTFWATDNARAPKARASTMNFVVVTVPAEVDRVRRSIEEFSHTRAGRAFLVTVDGKIPAWDLESNVSAVCLTEGEMTVCYDRIELCFGAMAASRVVSVLSALRLPEVPTIVEIGEGAPTAVADDVAALADRVIVDSARMALSRIADLFHKTPALIADRAWVRTYSWRELTARLFDDASSAAREVRSVALVRTLDEKCDPALLFLGWLSSRLGWKLDRRDHAVDARGRPVSIQLSTPVASGLGPGNLAAVRIETLLGGMPLRLACERLGSSRVVRWALSGARQDVHEHPLGYRDEHWVLGKAIDSTEADRVYREALMAAAAFASVLGAT